MFIDWGKKNIYVKIVYYGPAMSGKTTSIKKLFSKMNMEERVKSIETTTGRTLFFDYAPLSIKHNDWNIQVEVWSATGQDYYAETRVTVLNNTDGVIFIADSQKEYYLENKRSWEELISFFGEKLENEIPVVVCLNKYDLKNVMSDFDLRNLLNNQKETVFLKMIATIGHNVVESFKMLLELVFHQNFK
jgi:small GTP-binding protein